METSKDIEIEVLRVHSLFWESYARRDIDLRFSLCSEDITFIGSGLHERAVNKTEYKKINQEGVKQFPNHFQIEFLWTNLTMIYKNVACVESEVMWSQLINNEKTKELLRNTTLLKYDNDKWLVTHVHGSVPDYRLKDGGYMTNEQTIIRNRELEKQVFERTQDLNKTLEELKQKSCELEIETALEKVRSSALGMKKPEDMLDVCRIISDQLQSLGLNEIRNVQTAIFYETKKIYINFEYYTKHSKSIITEVDYRTHELQELFARKMLKGVEELFSETLRNKEVKDWYAYQKTTNQFADSFLETAESLSYYWYSLGPVALGMSTYYPLDEEEINLFKRFRNVFELAYRRFLDIQKAEAQAREAQIEVSLERVRAQAMEMTKPDDLLKICGIQFNELKKLGFTEIRNTLISIFYDDKGYFLDYDYSDYAGGCITKIFYNSHKVVDNYLKQIKGAIDAFAEIVIDGSQLNDWKEFRRGGGQKDDQRLENINALYYYMYSIGSGAIGFSNFKPVTEEQLAILKRFRNVFDLSYRRYNDIALAEAQAREAQIELALERIRARTMAMQKSDELAETAFVLFQQFKELGIEPKMLTIGIMNEQERIFEFWVTDWSGDGSKVNRKFSASIDEPILLSKIFSSWKAQRKSIEIELNNEELQKWINYRVKLSGVSDEKDYSNTKGFVVAANFSKGIISISAYESQSTETVQLLERFAGVFDLTYTRFLDLQKAEAQTREAQIEAALERVRSRTMGMQKSLELKEVIRVVYEQFVHLKVNVDHAGFVVDYTPKGDWYFWIADEQDIPSKITHPYFESVWANQFNEAKEKGANFFATNLNFEEKNKFYNELLSYVPGLPDASKDFYLSCPGFAATTVLFDNVSLYIENFSGTPYSDEDNKILMRFGKVFQQTYTRFLDLQKAEAQASEAEIQLALERVRARSLAMHQTSELQEVVNIVAQQLHNMNIDMNGGVFIAINDEVDNDIHLWASGGAADYVQKVTVPFLNKPVFISLRDAIKRKNNFFTEEHSLKEKIELFEHLFKYPPWNSLSQQRKQELLSREGGYTRSVAISHYTSISITNHNGKKFSDDDNEILKRFGSVFEQSYIRFLDLQKAEAQAREAMIEAALEKVRAVALSLKKSDEMLDIAKVLYEQLLELGFTNIRNAIIDIHNETNETFLDYDYSHDMGKTVTHMTYRDDPIIEKQVRQIETSSDAFFELVLEGEDLQDLIDMRLRNGEKEDSRLRQIEQLTYNLYSFGNGAIGISNFGMLSDEQKKILKRFRNVFAFAYKRYTEMVRAEEQSRETIKQASLDRVRGEIASMRTSEDLNRITPIIWRELKNLEVPFIRCGVFIIDEEKEYVQVYLTTPDGKSLGVLNLSFDSNELTHQTIEHWQKKQVYKKHWNKKEFINWTKSMIELGQIRNSETYQGSSTPPEALDLHFVPFTQGMLYVGDSSPLTDEKLDLVKTLAESFAIAFARYEDFKNLEEAKNKTEVTLAELKSAQAQLVQAEKLASLGQLTAGIAHEIKNPLNFVNNFSELSSELLDEMKIELQNNNNDEAIAIAEDIKQNLEKINQHGKRADSIVKGMLLHSRGTSGEKVLTNLNDLLDQYVALAYHGLRAQDKEFNITIEKDYDSSLEKINVVPQDISRVFLNIVNNGFYAANDKKKKSENDFAPILKVSTRNLPDKVEIRIRDNGNGIPQSIKNHIFNPFFTTKPTGEGTGLGLSLSYDIVTKVHNGEIIFDTKENEFTEFTITIPKS